MANGGPLILVVEDDDSIRRFLRTGLELEGFAVIEAATLAQARSVQAEQIDGVVLDRQLPDGDGLTAYEELRARYPGVTIVVHSSGPVPATYTSVPKGDLDAIVEVLGVAAAPVPVPDGPPELARAAAEVIVEDWLELCRWDPELPTDSRPPIAGSIVAAVASALERPQPVGWGLDPALEPLAEAYVLNHDAVDVAVGQLVCLREVFERRVVEGLPAKEQMETARRLTMIIQRLMTVVARVGLAQVQAAAFVDGVTGLGNSAAFDIDLRRETIRAARHGRPLTVVRLVAEGMGVALGGEDALRRVGPALRSMPGAEVHPYRLAWSDFAVILPDTVAVDLAFVEEPLRDAGLRAVAVGVATYPEDPLDQLEQLAEERLRRGAGQTPVPWSHRARHEGELEN